ncbi:mitochondrial carrier protein RIM2 [Ephemerocybe angulata]|uniref:Mitochondrial carrier protein RIM2 n=1 Tax=Ephemerocybe angulata TaxID=980116 RepID=A0A8H6M9U2_9AGAR|nr:mitochondrial carrier protein RIM2 [Tulosesus angulatus]
MAERDFWAHLVAGGTAGLTTAVLTSPLDVLRTRLQSNFYTRPAPATHGPTALLRNGFQSFAIFGDIARTEGWRGFFRGLGPSLAGVVPATAIKFHVYGNSKVFWGSVLDRKPEENAVAVHALAAMTAGVATATATNPIWVVKTRLQLESGADGKRRYKSSMDCTRQILKHEGVRGLYKGLSASYLGTVETVFHLGLYEQLKPVLSRLMGDSSKTGGTSNWDGLKIWISTTGAAGSAKLAATVFTYPHEVIRTRLRQAPTVNGVVQYTGLVQCFVSIWKQEGMAGLYGGIMPHLTRSIPSAMITLGVYEFVLRVISGL